MLARSLANGVAVVHLAVIIFVLTGGLLSWRWPRLTQAHLPVVAAVLAVNLAHADCPLTTLELWLRGWAGEPGYLHGFIGHYLVRPIRPDGITPGIGAALGALATVPNVVAYTVLLARHRPAALTARIRRPHLTDPPAGRAG